MYQDNTEKVYKKVSEVFPPLLMETKNRAKKYGSEDVIKESYFDWPGPQKNIEQWVELRSGMKIGFQEITGKFIILKD